jgi:hypothetical protein
MIVQRWERSPETSVNILLYAGSSYDRPSVWGYPGLANGRRFDDRPQRSLGNSPCRGYAPAVARDLTSPDHAPVQGSLKCASHFAANALRQPSYLATAPAMVISRLTAQMKPASSRATAVMATFLSLPFRISVR